MVTLVLIYSLNSAIKYSIFVKNTTSLRPVTPIGIPFIQIGEVDSSNNYAMAQAQAQLADHGATFFTSYQTAGKGQRGKHWNAESGKNIMLSCVLKPNLISIDNQFVLIAAIALACYDFFKYYAGDETSIKWPNDIYWKDRKAGGILIESILQGSDWKFAIAGIGININQTIFSPYLPNPVSLKQITGKSHNPIELGKELCGFLQKRWEMLVPLDKQFIIDEYNASLYKKDEMVRLKKQDAFFSARNKGVNEKGELIIDTGIVSIIPFGEVEWVIP